MGEGGKYNFYCFARQRRSQQANALKTVPSFKSKQEGVENGLGVENTGTGKDQGRCKFAVLLQSWCLVALAADSDDPSFWNKKYLIKQLIPFICWGF